MLGVSHYLRYGPRCLWKKSRLNIFKIISRPCSLWSYPAPRITYRGLPNLPTPRQEIYAAELVGGVMWYWIIYHCLTQYGHIIGEFPYPNISKWTDEELGIPPDDED